MIARQTQQINSAKHGGDGIITHTRARDYDLYKIIKDTNAFTEFTEKGSNYSYVFYIYIFFLH